MARAYSYDLRQKVIRALELDGWKKSEVAEIFQINRASRLVAPLPRHYIKHRSDRKHNRTHPIRAVNILGSPHKGA